MAENNQISIAAPAIGQDEIDAVIEVLQSGWITQGTRVAEFEKNFAAYHGVKHALAVTSCTAGLHLALIGLGVGPGDEVIVPAFTWIATASTVVQCGATPIFVDIHDDSYNINSEKIKEKISRKTKAIIVVHLFGLCAEMDIIKSEVPDNIHIIEDAACAAGSKYGELFAGCLGDVGVFSFHPRKPITTGEGGMITTDNDELAEKLARLRNHGASIPEEVRHKSMKPHDLPAFEEYGFNYRMTDLQGAVGMVQLSKLDDFILERSKWAAWYRSELSTVSWLRCPKDPVEGRHSWQAFVAWVELSSPVPRDKIMDILLEENISTRPGTHAITDLGVSKGIEAHCPVASQCADQTIALPIHNKMSPNDYKRVVKAITRI